MSTSPYSSLPADASRAALIEHLLYLGQMQSTETAHFHQTAATINDLNITDSKTLSVLMQEGAMTAGQLAARLSLTSGAVTSVLDRLESRDYIWRTQDPDDRRKVVIEPNLPKLNTSCAKPYISIGKAFEQLYKTYSTEQLKFLAQFSETAIKLTAQEICKLHDDH